MRRACPGASTPSAPVPSQGVDGRDKPGHDVAGVRHDRHCRPGTEILERHRRGRRRGRARSRARRGARQERLGHGAAEDARRHDAGRAQGAGPGDQRPQGPRQRGAQRAPRRLQGRGARRAARHRDRRRHPAGARGADRSRPRPSDQPGGRRTHRDLRRHGLRRRRRSGHRDRRLQLHQAELPRGPSGPRDARHVLLPAEAGRLAACCCARTPRRCRCAPC